MIDIYNNKMAFINMKPRGLFIIFNFITIILIMLLIGAYKIKIYDNYQTKGYINNGTITALIPTNIKIEKLKINNKNENLNIQSKEVIIDEENYFSYLKIVLKTDTPYDDKSIVNLNFYYNKQRIIEKIKEKMF